MMTGQELTREEVFALAGAFRVDSAKALLSVAGFPAWAVPETGYANAREFWTKISEQLQDGAMPDGRAQILDAARDWFPANQELAALAAAAALPATRPPDAGNSVSAGQAGLDSVQIINHSVIAERVTAQPHPPRPAAALRILVIGASPLDPDLPHLRADREAHAIERAAAPDRLELKVILGAEATDIQRVGTVRPDIVHFVCHGTADSLVFSDAGGESDYVAATRIAQRLRFYREEKGVRLRGVVLAACDGDQLAQCFADVADTVIAHRGKLADQCGVAFAEQFYTLLSAQAGVSPAQPAPPPGGPDLAAVAREAAQLTAGYSAACDPVIDNLIVLRHGG